MASIRTLLEALLELDIGKKITVGVEDKNEYETVRTRLVQLWTQHKEIITAITDEDPILAYSLCGDYDGATGSGSFYLGKPRRRTAKHYNFVIADDSATESLDNVSSTNPPTTEADTRDLPRYLESSQD
jgi:hypothetical protein